MKYSLPSHRHILISALKTHVRGDVSECGVLASPRAVSEGERERGRRDKRGEGEREGRGEEWQGGRKRRCKEGKRASKREAREGERRRERPRWWHRQTASPLRLARSATASSLDSTRNSPHTGAGRVDVEHSHTSLPPPDRDRGRSHARPRRRAHGTLVYC